MNTLKTPAQTTTVRVINPDSHAVATQDDLPRIWEQMQD